MMRLRRAIGRNKTQEETGTKKEKEEPAFSLAQG
jgi:hypothetical protein